MLEELIAYLKAIIVTPKKAFQKIAVAKNPGRFLPILIIFQIIAVVITRYLSIYSRLSQSGSSHQMNLLFAILYATAGWIAVYAMTHLVNRRFTQKGTFFHLLAASGLVTMVTAPFHWIIGLLSSLGQSLLFFSSIVSLWSFYLILVAISAIYHISKGRAFMDMFIAIVLLSIAVVIFGVFFFPQLKAVLFS